MLGGQNLFRVVAVADVADSGSDLLALIPYSYPTIPQTTAAGVELPYNAIGRGAADATSIVPPPPSTPTALRFLSYPFFRIGLLKCRLLKR
jgi:hypothetical protein